MSSSLVVRYWGVRGSFPTPRPENLLFGGHTPCVTLSVRDSQFLVLDGGLGLQRVGRLDRFQQSGEAHIVLSHFHWDHVQGIPFFAPIYLPSVRVTFYSGFSTDLTRQAVERQMAAPHFPVDLSQRIPSCHYVQIPPEGIETAGFAVRPVALHHPGGCFGYLVSHGTRSLLYGTDFEHGDPTSDQIIRRAAQGTELLIYDSHFAPDDYQRHRGWGHSTWKEAVAIARDSGVPRLHLFHHNPEYSDEEILAMEAEAQAAFPATHAAREGEVVEL